METTKKTEKKFDAVKMMREIRDKVSSETQDMSFEELKKYLKKQIAESKLKPIGKQGLTPKWMQYNSIDSLKIKTKKNTKQLLCVFLCLLW